MLYHKFKLNNEVELKVELYEDQIFTYCGACNKEMEVGLEDIVHIYNEDADFVGTTFYCNPCAEKRKKQREQTA